MWLVRPDDNDREYMLPLSENIDTCNSPYQGLPIVYAQTAALEIAWTNNIFEYGNVSGDIVRPFYMPEYESMDINLPIDWIMAEEMCKRGLVSLVKI
jgi:CMP-N-acetylneuraminic acid synthetase